MAKFTLRVLCALNLLGHAVSTGIELHDGSVRFYTGGVMEAKLDATSVNGLSTVSKGSVDGGFGCYGPRGQATCVGPKDGLLNCNVYPYDGGNDVSTFSHVEMTLSTSTFPANVPFLVDWDMQVLRYPAETSHKASILHIYARPGQEIVIFAELWSPTVCNDGAMHHYTLDAGVTGWQLWCDGVALAGVANASPFTTANFAINTTRSMSFGSHISYVFDPQGTYYCRVKAAFKNLVLRETSTVVSRDYSVTAKDLVLEGDVIFQSDNGGLAATLKASDIQGLQIHGGLWSLIGADITAVRSATIKKNTGLLSTTNAGDGSTHGKVVRCTAPVSGFYTLGATTGKYSSSLHCNTLFSLYGSFDCALNTICAGAEIIDFRHICATAAAEEGGLGFSHTFWLEAGDYLEPDWYRGANGASGRYVAPDLPFHWSCIKI